MYYVCQNELPPFCLRRTNFTTENHRLSNKFAAPLQKSAKKTPKTRLKQESIAIDDRNLSYEYRPRLHLTLRLHVPAISYPLQSR